MFRVASRQLWHPGWHNGGNMALKEYARKRNFSKTPEPAPGTVTPSRDARSGFFCVQRHDATHLHYDFRLEVNGALVSWAVPRGPSLDPKRKALAMKVEDHPLEYGTFEGNIPAGNYGGGSVMLWDVGRFEVLGDTPAQEQIDRGDFKFALHGTKLNGSFAIVHMKHASKGNEWLLIKKQDEFVVTGYDIDQFAWSIATRRTQDQIADETQKTATSELGHLGTASKLPNQMDPMLASAATGVPHGDRWSYEIKWDGVRALCRIEKGVLQIYSRRGNRCEQQYPELHSLPQQINATDAWLDGEICVLDDNGRARFNLIQYRIGANASSVPKLAQTSPATLFVFDLLFLNGRDLRGLALGQRRELLHTVLTPSESIRISEAFDTEGEQMLDAAEKMGLEGVLAKSKNSTYVAGRSPQWLKLKIRNEQEFVIAGFTKGERDYFGALVLAERDEEGWRHVGQVGTGFDQKMMKAIYERLEPLITKTSSLKNKPRIKSAIWVYPQVVCQVSFQEWTKDGILRAPVFISLRDDKAAQDVVHEEAVRPENVEPQAPTQSSPEPEVNAVQRLEIGGKEAVVEIDRHRLKFSNLSKVLFPNDGWTKRDLLSFYNQVSPWLLPHLKDRPLSLKRYPNGIHQEFFFQKNASAHFPDWMRCHPIEEHTPPKINHYPLADNQAGLLYLVNLGCIDQNPRMSRVESLDTPDWILLDLDPVDASFDLLIEAALLLREILDGCGLRGYPKTTGGDGMHIYVPLEPVYTFEQARTFAELLSHIALERQPNLFTTPRSVNKRVPKRVYFDYLQIASGKTIAAPYVVRAYDGAAVATPLEWKEVKRGLRPHDFRIDNAVERFKQVGDLFAPVLEGGQRLEDALERLSGGERSKSIRKRATAKATAKRTAKGTKRV